MGSSTLLKQCPANCSRLERSVELIRGKDPYRLTNGLCVKAFEASRCRSHRVNVLVRLELASEPKNFRAEPEKLERATARWILALGSDFTAIWMQGS